MFSVTVPGDSFNVRKPLCFAKMYNVSSFKQSVDHAIKLQVSASNAVFNAGVMMQVAAFPPPASLSSIKVEPERSSGQEPNYPNPVHHINVKAKKALLIMSANGQVKGGGVEYLTYTVDDVAPTSDGDPQGRRFGQYWVTSASTAGGFSPLGLYQLAEVGHGEHTVRLDGDRTLVGLDYVTSQVTTIPIENTQYTTVMGEWELHTNRLTTTVLLTANVDVPSNSTLVITATFTSYVPCDKTVVMYHFNVDGNRLLPSDQADDPYQLQLRGGAWYAGGGSMQYTRMPGSLLLFAHVTEGEHNVELVNFVEHETCGAKTEGAVLQVGVVPETYFY